MVGSFCHQLLPAWGWPAAGWSGVAECCRPLLCLPGSAFRRWCPSGRRERRQRTWWLITVVGGQGVSRQLVAAGGVTPQGLLTKLGMVEAQVVVGGGVCPSALLASAALDCVGLMERALHRVSACAAMATTVSNLLLMRGPRSSSGSFLMKRALKVKLSAFSSGGSRAFMVARNRLGHWSSAISEKSNSCHMACKGDREKELSRRSFNVVYRVSPRFSATSLILSPVSGSRTASMWSNFVLSCVCLD